MNSRVFLASSMAAAVVSASAHSALVYGGGTPVGAGTNAGVNPGAGVIAYMNCFTPIAGPGDTQLEVSEVILGIDRRRSGGVLVGVGVNVYVAQMTYDGSTYGRGENQLVFSTSLAGGGTTATLQTVATGSLMGIVLDLETTSMSGFGGWWIGVEFTGANAANAANRWRAAFAPAVGVSNNNYATFNSNTGVFTPALTIPNSSNSRFLVDVDGQVIPAPGVLGLLGLFGLVGRRRR